MKQQTICIGCGSQREGNVAGTIFDIRYIDKTECGKCARSSRAKPGSGVMVPKDLEGAPPPQRDKPGILESSPVNGQTVKVEVTGYDPEKVGS